MFIALLLPAFSFLHVVCNIIIAERGIFSIENRPVPGEGGARQTHETCETYEAHEMCKAYKVLVTHKAHETGKAHGARKAHETDKAHEAHKAYR